MSAIGAQSGQRGTASAADAAARGRVSVEDRYTATAQAYQQVKIEELRNSRSISIIESPEVHAIDNPRGLLKAIILGAMVGFLIGSLIALLREHIAKAHLVRPREGDEFRTLRKKLWQELRSPVRTIRQRKHHA